MIDSLQFCCVPEHSLRHSKHHQLCSIVTSDSSDDDDDDDDEDINVDDAVLAIAAIKKVNVSVCPA